MNMVKINLLKDTFEKRFNITSFKRFIKEFFNEPEMIGEKRYTGIWREYTAHINAYYNIANYIDNEGNKLIVLAVELRKGISIDRARSMQRNFISKILDENNLEAAIVAFYNDDEPGWRLSFVRLDYSFTGKGLALDLTPVRRYSYLVGENEPNHTAQIQLLPIFQDDKHNPTLDEIEYAFSVEKVTKDFFMQYKEKYFEFKIHLENDDSFTNEAKKLGIGVEKFAEQFSKKLMGQLAFLYFLQKKGWLGVKIVPKTISKNDLTTIYNSVENNKKEILKEVYRKKNQDTYELDVGHISSNKFNNRNAGLLSEIFAGNEKFDEAWGSGYKQFIREVLWKHCEKSNKNFFTDYLEPFFYEALNIERKNHYFKTFNCKVPFLNAGLFEPLEGYGWEGTNFNIPNALFSNEQEKGRDADGMLDIFDRYNFTMNEDEPLEKEVAVDPEMLGKIFENLLEPGDRKAKGAFYTPREIVHYMCQESLVNYLVNEVDLPYEDLKEFILYGELIKDADSRRDVGYGKDFTIKQSILDNIVKIDKALETVRIADPAVGSGAFPLGMLNEIIKARNNITEYIIRKDKEGAFGSQYGEKLIRQRRSLYKMKLETIKNSIFAVDIEPSAIDIAKLRLWLSIVVEQEINEDNPAPHPLPNLDVNIHVGNSLIDEYEGIKLFDKSVLDNQVKGTLNKKEAIIEEQLRLLFDSDEILKEMYDKQNRYYDEYNEEKKKSLKRRIDELRDQLIILKLKEHGKVDKIEKHNSIKNERLKPYFIWELEFAKVFEEKGGFDIVIGNPPYVGEKGNKEIFRDIAKTEFGKVYYQGKMDLFYFFFHLAINISKEKGVISFITTNYYVTADSAIKLRKDIRERTAILNLINFFELKIFETALGQHNMITIIQKSLNFMNLKAKMCMSNRCGVADELIFQKIFNWKDEQTDYFEKPQEEIYDTKKNYIRIGDSNDKGSVVGGILAKLLDDSYRIGERCIINTGVNTGCDKVTRANYEKVYGNLNFSNGINKNDGIFVISELEFNEMKLNVYEKERIVKFYKNSEISKYFAPTKWGREYLIYMDKDVDIQKYPNIINHLNKYRGFTELKREFQEGKLPWYSLHWAREKEVFTDKDKIVFPYRSKKNIFAHCPEDFYASKDVLYIRKADQTVEMKYLLALLNSKLYYYWLWYKGKVKGKTLELYVTPVSEIPVKRKYSKVQEIIIKKAEKMVSYYKDGNKEDEAHLLQLEIDNLIYEDFKLDEKEKDQVENLFKNNMEVI